MINTYAEAQSYLALHKLAADSRQAAVSDPEVQNALVSQWKATCRLGLKFDCKSENGSYSSPKGLKRALTILARWYLFEKGCDPDAVCDKLEVWYRDIHHFYFSIAYSAGEKTQQRFRKELEDNIKKKFRSRELHENLEHCIAYHAVCRAMEDGPLEQTQPRIPAAVLERWKAENVNTVTAGMLLLWHYLSKQVGAEPIVVQQDVKLWFKRSDGGDNLAPIKSIITLEKHTYHGLDVYRLRMNPENAQLAEWDDGSEDGYEIVEDSKTTVKDQLEALLKATAKEEKGKKASLLDDVEFDPAIFLEQWTAIRSKGDKSKKYNLHSQNTDNKVSVFVKLMLFLFLTQEEPDAPIEDWDVFWQQLRAKAKTGKSAFPFPYPTAEDAQRIAASWPVFREKLISAHNDLFPNGKSVRTCTLTAKTDSITLEISEKA